jgi:hypothetical protein
LAGVAHVRGNEAGFVDVLVGFVPTESELSEPLRSPVDDVDQIRFALQDLGRRRPASQFPACESGYAS